jgi:DNA-binding MarR family transcriptional regulator
MWANFMQFVPGDGVPLHEVDDLAHITNLAGLQRWGYVTVGPDPADGRPAPPRRDWIVRPTRAVRVLTAGGIRIGELPYLTGVSKEALSMAAGILTRRSCAETGPDPAASRGKVIRLTPRGRSAQDGYLRLLGAVEQRWRARFGPAAIDTLRRSLSVTGQRDDGRPRLALGLRPYPDGWRARGPYLRQTTAVLNDPGAALPHYPMVLHRGGWPDGS